MAQAHRQEACSRDYDSPGRSYGHGHGHGAHDLVMTSPGGGPDADAEIGAFGGGGGGGGGRRGLGGSSDALHHAESLVVSEAIKLGSNMVTFLL